MTAKGYEGGAPILGERLAIDLMNTDHAVRGKPAEGFGSPEDATAWVRQLAPRLEEAGAPSAADAQVLGAELDALLDLRKAMRALADALIDGRTAEEGDLRKVNRLAAVSPHWTSLSWKPDGGATKTTHAAGTPLEQVLGVLAGDAIELFTGSDSTRLRLCERPGCPLFFLKDHPRREWCTPSCGARVRAARSYQKRAKRERAASF